MDQTIDANSSPTTTNFVTFAQVLTHLLNGKLQIESNLTNTTNLGICQYWLGSMIKEYSEYSELKGYVSPEQYLATPHYLTKMSILEPLVDIIKGNMTTEDEPAYTRRMGMGYGGGGAELE